MKKLLSLLMLIFVVALLWPAASFAQGMMGYLNTSPDSSSVQSQRQEEQEGKNFLENLSRKTITCTQLGDGDFEKIGEYFMGQSIGDTQRHIIMNEMMKRMMGQSGEEQMHTVMGKRFSGCDTTVAFPAQDVGFMSMMNMMGGNQSYFGYNSGFGSMMSLGTSPFSVFSGPMMLIGWVLIIVGVVSLVKWLLAQTRGRRKIR